MRVLSTANLTESSALIKISLSQKYSLTGPSEGGRRGGGEGEGVVMGIGVKSYCGSVDELLLWLSG